MRGIGKSLLRSASVIALLAGGSTLLPREAPAQIDIPGMVFGAMSHYGEHYRGRHGRVHESKHKRGSKEEAKDEEPANGKAPAQPDQTSKKETPQTPASTASSTPTPPPSSGEVPTFSPSR